MATLYTTECTHPQDALCASLEQGVVWCSCCQTTVLYGSGYVAPYMGQLKQENEEWQKRIAWLNTIIQRGARDIVRESGRAEVAERYASDLRRELVKADRKVGAITAQASRDTENRYKQGLEIGRMSAEDFDVGVHIHNGPLERIVKAVSTCFWR